MRVGLMTREYPPNVYGGAGVHVEYLARELARSIEVEVHCWGTQHEDAGNLHVRGDEPGPDLRCVSWPRRVGQVDDRHVGLTGRQPPGRGQAKPGRPTRNRDCCIS